MEQRTLEEVAIVIRPEADNVAVVVVELLEEGTQLHYKGELLTIPGRLLRGQSLVISSLQEGQTSISLGDPFGVASRPVRPGDPIDEANLDRSLPRVRPVYRDSTGLINKTAAVRAEAIRKAELAEGRAGIVHRARPEGATTVRTRRRGLALISTRRRRSTTGSRPAGCIWRSTRNWSSGSLTGG